MRRAVTLIVVLIVAAPLWVPAADTYSIDAVHSDVSFSVRHLVSKVRGAFNDFDAKIVADLENPQASSVSFTIQAEIEINLAAVLERPDETS